MKLQTVKIRCHEGNAISSIDFHPPSATLATAGADFKIKFWTIKPAGAQKKQLPSVSNVNNLSNHSSAVNVIRFSPSGSLLASGAEAGEMLIWKSYSTDTGQRWNVLKTLRSHLKGIMDLEWSPDGAYLISGSVDHRCIIWDINKGTNLQTLEFHTDFVQGVAWDPLGKFVISFSSDRTCRVFVNKPHKSKGIQKADYVCQLHVSKPILEISQSKKFHIFHDKTLPSFFRRLAWSPDGSFLVVPAGLFKINTASESENVAYIFSRDDLSRPAIKLSCDNKPAVAVRFCPIFFKLRGTNSATAFNLLAFKEKDIPHDLLVLIKTKHLRMKNIKYRILNHTLDSGAIALFDAVRNILAMHFAPIRDDNGDEVLSAMVYGNSAFGENMSDMCCAVLRLDGIVVSTALFRILGPEVAEIPFVATSLVREGKGFFSCLFSVLERVLSKMKVSTLIVPSSEERLMMWTSKYGFSRISLDEAEHHKTQFPKLKVFRKPERLVRKNL